MGNPQNEQIATRGFEAFNTGDLSIVDEVTADLVRGLSETDSRIRYVHTDRVGLSCGRNDGIAVSRGDVVAFTDDDCIVQPDWLSAIDVEMQDPRVAGVFGRVLPNEYRGRSGIDLAFKDSQERIEYAEKADQLVPNNPAILDTLGVLLVDKGDMKRGIESLQRATALAPNAPGIRLNLARALVRDGQKEAAKKELQTLAQLGDKFPAQAEVTKLMQGL